MEMTPGKPMIKHSLSEGVLVAFLVGLMLYSISPGEVQIAYDGLKRKLAGTASGSLVALHLRAPPAAESEPVPPISPAAPGPRPANVLRTIWGWLQAPELVAFLLAGGGILWMGRSKHRRQFRAESERKMAIKLTRAVRHMGDRSPEPSETFHDG
jgi:hypothetical protein